MIYQSLEIVAKQLGQKVSKSQLLHSQTIITEHTLYSVREISILRNS